MPSTNEATASPLVLSAVAGTEPVVTPVPPEPGTPCAPGSSAL